MKLRKEGHSPDSRRSHYPAYLHRYGASGDINLISTNENVIKPLKKEDETMMGFTKELL